MGIFFWKVNPDHFQGLGTNKISHLSGQTVSESCSSSSGISLGSLRPSGFLCIAKVVVFGLSSEVSPWLAEQAVCVFTRFPINLKVQREGLKAAGGEET